ncbi:hypothetical protein D3C79_909550 [compost metagenome]
MLPFAVAACNIAVMEDDHFPELLHGLQIKALALTQHTVPVQRPEEFRNRCIGMLTLQNIPALMYRSEQAQLVEHVGSL